MIRYAVAALALTTIYALALASLAPWDILAGLAVSSALLFTARRRFGRGLSPSNDAVDDERIAFGEALRRVAAFPRFAGAVVRETVFGAWRVLLAVLGVRPPNEPGMVAVPLDDRTPEGIAVSAFLAAFSPGTLLVRVDEEERVMWIHAMDAADPEAVRRERREFYERYQRKVFP
ncbi:MAG: Na+/H+ antiporter subunit E [Actinomycetota bacterium]|nr:Na+/H+ antiporter subunit E [Actinomycetota bacterium]